MVVVAAWLECVPVSLFVPRGQTACPGPKQQGHLCLCVSPEAREFTQPTLARTLEQLSLTPGQLILVLAKNSSGWWLGELQVRRVN